jgi:hypothetical protein
MIKDNKFKDRENDYDKYNDHNNNDRNVRKD